MTKPGYKYTQEAKAEMLARRAATREKNGTKPGRVKGSKNSPEAVEAQRERMIEKWRDPIYREHHSEGMKKYRDSLTPEELRETARALIDYWSVGENRKRQSEVHTGVPLSEEHRAAIGKALLGNKNAKGYKHSKETIEFFRRLIS